MKVELLVVPNGEIANFFIKSVHLNSYYFVAFRGRKISANCVLALSKSFEHFDMLQSSTWSLKWHLDMSQKTRLLNIVIVEILIY